MLLSNSCFAGCWSDVVGPALLEQAGMVQRAVAWGTPAAQRDSSGIVHNGSHLQQVQEQPVDDASIFLALLAQEMVAEQATAAAAQATHLQDQNSTH
jgi:hypothetical protein